MERKGERGREGGKKEKTRKKGPGGGEKKITVKREGMQEIYTEP